MHIATGHDWVDGVDGHWEQRTLPWEPIECAPSGRLVMTQLDDGRGPRNIQAMVRGDKYWFAGGELVSYAPTEYRELTDQERACHGGVVASSNRRYRVDEMFR